jgi:hypothetical protein
MPLDVISVEKTWMGIGLAPGNLEEPAGWEVSSIDPSICSLKVNFHD